MRRALLLLSAAAACGGTTAPAAEPRLEPAAPAKLSGQVLVYRDAWLDDGGASYYARAGEPVYWPDGRAAGRVVADTSLYGESVVNAGRACYAKPIRDEDAVEPGASILLCFEERK